MGITDRGRVEGNGKSSEKRFFPAYLSFRNGEIMRKTGKRFYEGNWAAFLKIIETFINMTSSDQFITKCAECLTEIETSISELEENNQLVCPECFAVNVVDVEKYRDQRRAIMDRVFGKRPDTPTNN
jgi:hypothetical protein